MPVTAISYYDAIVWCNAYSEMMGYTPVYYSSTTDRSPSAVIRKTTDLSLIEGSSPYYTSDYVLWTANGYRLPTEGEWHFASSCGGYYPYNHVSGNINAACSTGAPTSYSAWANWLANASDNKTIPVDGNLSNIWGIHNMSGNVWEYCFDLYSNAPTSDQTDYVCKVPTDPTDPAVLGAIVCGGSFSNGHSVECTTVGNRTKTGLSNGSIDNGFRLARTITQ
jgi:formylglycine-generating enzyme required for sulfatase activity